MHQFNSKSRGNHRILALASVCFLALAVPVHAQEAAEADEAIVASAADGAWHAVPAVTGTTFQA